MAEEKKKIFIADDDEIILNSLKKLLTLSNFEVETTQDAKKIGPMVKNFKPNIILLDLLMPNMGGFEVCEMLNNDNETKGIPIIVVSALGGYTDIKKAYQLGVIGYVTKPYDFSKLVEKIHKAILYKEGRT
ncbi:response regulator [bacterium]|nr:MAG: response regulator [bacterium]